MKNTENLKNKQFILFDLDGTITDPKEGITKSVLYALSKFDIKVDDVNSLTSFIGSPLKNEYMTRFSMTEEQAKEAVSYHKEYYNENGIFDCKLFDGITKFFDSLIEKNKKIYLATSKVTPSAKLLLDHFNITDYFTFIGGSAEDGTRATKDEVIEYVLKENNLTDLDKIVMIGDKSFDSIGAHSNGIECVGILYGYGGEMEHLDANADYIVKTIDDLITLF